jgi:hypothetical protein
MANYTIIGGDQKEYGPIAADDVRQWIAEGRLNEQSLIKVEGDAEFRPLGTFAEFGDAFTSGGSIPNMPTAFAGSVNWEERDYELDMGGCISRGWNLVKNNFGLLFVAALLVVLIEGAISALGSIPHIGAIFSLANLFVAGPLLGGLYYVFIQAIRGGPAQVGDVFAGFRKNFLQLFLGHIVPALIMGLCLIPFVIVLIIVLAPMAAHGQFSDPKDIVAALSGTALAVCITALFICIVPLIYLQTCWAFTLPLIIDKQMDFWTAMGTSRKMVKKHWWLVFGLMILIGLLNVAGMLACCVGIFVTMPIGFAALMYAYEIIFSERQTA